MPRERSSQRIYEKSFYCDRCEMYWVVLDHRSYIYDSCKSCHRTISSKSMIIRSVIEYLWNSTIKCILVIFLVWIKCIFNSFNQREKYMGWTWATRRVTEPVTRSQTQTNGNPVMSGNSTEICLTPAFSFHVKNFRKVRFFHILFTRFPLFCL